MGDKLDLYKKIIETDEGKKFVFSIPKNANIGCMISGGADSAILAYILAKTIKDEGLGTKIYPVTAELLRRPFNIRFSGDVIEKIEELTGFKFEEHLIFPIRNHTKKMTDEMKTDVMNQCTNFFAIKFNFETMFDGITANPPLEAIQTTEFSLRPTDRDDIEFRKNKETKDGLDVPFIHFDKRDIAHLYKKMNVLSELFPLTRSCEGEAHESELFTKDCFDVRSEGMECWWCKEREYGFREFKQKGEI